MMNHPVWVWGREGGRKREKEGVERGLEREQVGGCEVE